MSHWLWVFGQTRLNYLLLSYIRNQSVIFTFVPHKQGRVSAGCPDWIGDRGWYHSNRLDELIRSHPSVYLVLLFLRVKVENFRKSYFDRVQVLNFAVQILVILSYSGSEFWVDISWDKWEKFNSQKSFGFRLLNFGDRISNCGSLLVVWVKTEFLIWDEISIFRSWKNFQISG